MKYFEPPKRDDDLVRLSTFPGPLPAHSLRILLEACGVKAVVTGEESNSTFGGPGMGDAGMVGVQVLVHRADYEEAKQIMLEVPAAAEVLLPAWNCQCGVEVDEGFAICWACGFELEEHWDEQ
jgi:hypothetical protein